MIQMMPMMNIKVIILSTAIMMTILTMVPMKVKALFLLLYIIIFVLVINDSDEICVWCDIKS